MFVAQLGVLRTLEAAGAWSDVRVSWSVDEPPVRPVLHLPRAADRGDVVRAIARGVAELAGRLCFPHRDLAFTPAEGRELLVAARDGNCCDVWSALVSDAAESRDGNRLEPTPLCLMFGQGHQHFLARLESVPALERPPSRRSRGPRVSQERSLHEALFAPRRRSDPTPAFRWDPREDVRYALRATDPTDPASRGTTQHGANRLAAVGLPVLVVAPQRRAGRVRLGFRGGGVDARGRHTVSWPIWRHPLGLAGLTSLLDHPGIEGDSDERRALGVVEVRRATRVTNGRYLNVTRAVAVEGGRGAVARA